MTVELGFQMTMQRLETGESRNDGQARGKSVGGSWFEALAQALGGMLGQRVEALIDAKNRMVENYKSDLDTKSGEQQSKAYMEAMTDFQVQSQIFGMESQMSSTAIKAIGEGLISVARKQ